MDKEYNGAELVVHDVRFTKQTVKPNTLYILKDNREMKVTRVGTKRWLEPRRKRINKVMSCGSFNACEEILTMRLSISGLVSDGGRVTAVIVNIPKRIVKKRKCQIICISKNYIRRKQLEVDLEYGKHDMVEINLDYHSEIAFVKEMFELDRCVNVDSWNCNHFKQLKDTLIILVHRTNEDKTLTWKVHKDEMQAVWNITTRGTVIRANVEEFNKRMSKVLREILQDECRVNIDRLSQMIQLTLKRRNMIYYLDGNSLLGSFSRDSFKYCRREPNEKQIRKKIDVRGDKLSDYIGVTLYWFHGKLYNRKLQPVIVEEVEKVVDRRLSGSMGRGTREDRVKASSKNNVGGGDGHEMDTVRPTSEIGIDDKIESEMERKNNKDVGNEESKVNMSEISALSSN